MIQPTTLERLRDFRLQGFIDALLLQAQSSHYHDLSFEDRLTLLVDAEHTRRVVGADEEAPLNADLALGRIFG